MEGETHSNTLHIYRYQCVLKINEVGDKGGDRVRGVDVA